MTLTVTVTLTLTPPLTRPLRGPGQASEEEALATLDSALAQARRVTGAYFVGRGARHGFASLEDLWDE